jgi:hypothetical protein
MVEHIKSKKPDGVIITDTKGKHIGYFSPDDYKAAVAYLKQQEAAKTAPSIEEAIAAAPPPPPPQMPAMFDSPTVNVDLLRQLAATEIEVPPAPDLDAMPAASEPSQTEVEAQTMAAHAQAGRLAAEAKTRKLAELEAAKRAQLEGQVAAESQAKTEAEAKTHRLAELEADKRAELEAQVAAEAKARADAEAKAQALADQEAAARSEMEAKLTAAEEARRYAEKKALEAQEEAELKAAAATKEESDDAQKQAQMAADLQAKSIQAVEAAKRAELEAQLAAERQARQQAEAHAQQTQTSAEQAVQKAQDAAFAKVEEIQASAKVAADEALQQAQAVAVSSGTLDIVIDGDCVMVTQEEVTEQIAPVLGHGELEPTIWEEEGSELLVHPSSLRVVIDDGFLTFSLDVESEQSGRVNVTIPICVGNSDDLSNLHGGVHSVVEGEPVIVGRWSHALQDVMWHALLDLVDRICIVLDEHVEDEGVQPMAIGADDGKLWIRVASVSSNPTPHPGPVAGPAISLNDQSMMQTEPFAPRGPPGGGF